MDIAVFFFSLTNQVKLYHWQTTSYARHIATDNLFTVLLPLVDRFMEVYQGKANKRISSTHNKIMMQMTIYKGKEFDDYLKKCVEYLSVIINTGYVKESDTDLLNIRDEIVGELNKTLYLFSFEK